MANEISVANITNHVAPLYTSDYLLAAQPRLYWQQMSWVWDSMGARRGDSIKFPFFENMDPVTSTLSETSDPSNADINDALVTMTFAEYGSVVTVTEKLSALAYTEAEKGIAEVVGYNMAESLDLIVRPYYNQGSHVLYASGATRVGLGRNDKINFGLITRLISFARARKVPQFDDGYYCTIVHPNVVYDLMQDPAIQNAMIHNDVDRIWNGEVGSIVGLRIIQAPNGRVFLSAGVSEVATTANDASIAAGDTVFTVTSATGYTAGDFITIGTLESGATEQAITEQVQIVSISGQDLTILGEGNSQTNAGLRFDHANGVAVTLAPNVYSVPLMGPQSVAQGASDHTGPLGEMRFTGPFDKLGRLYHVGWYGIWAFARVSEKWLMRLECTATY